MNEMSEIARAPARSGFAIGIAVLILGVLAVMAPLAAGTVAVMLIAVALVASGIAQTVFAFKSNSFGEGLMRFLFGGLTILCGIVMFGRPFIGLATLTMVIGFYFIAIGIARLMFAFQLKPAKGWGWLVFDGLISFLLAFMILREWPMSGVWAIGVLIGAHLIMEGWTLIMLGSVGEQAVEELESAAG